MAGKPRKKTVHWTAEEIENLEAAVAKYRPGKWKQMKDDPEFHFYRDRTAQNLKDKYLNLHPPSDGTRKYRGVDRIEWQPEWEQSLLDCVERYNDDWEQIQEDGFSDLSIAELKQKYQQLTTETRGQKRERAQWTAELLDQFQEALDKYGTNYAVILNAYPDLKENFTAKQLNYKYINHKHKVRTESRPSEYDSEDVDTLTPDRREARRNSDNESEEPEISPVRQRNPAVQQTTRRLMVPQPRNTNGRMMTSPMRQSFDEMSMDDLPGQFSSRSPFHEGGRGIQPAARHQHYVHEFYQPDYVDVDETLERARFQRPVQSPVSPSNLNRFTSPIRRMRRPNQTSLTSPLAQSPIRHIQTSPIRRTNNRQARTSPYEHYSRTPVRRSGREYYDASTSPTRPSPVTERNSPISSPSPRRRGVFHRLGSAFFGDARTSGNVDPLFESPREDLWERDGPAPSQYPQDDEEYLPQVEDDQYYSPEDEIESEDDPLPDISRLRQRRNSVEVVEDNDNQTRNTVRRGPQGRFVSAKEVARQGSTQVNAGKGRKGTRR